MGIKTITANEVTCQRCGATIIVANWQGARKHGWAVPCDGHLQLCPKCVEFQKGVFIDPERVTTKGRTKMKLSEQVAELESQVAELESQNENLRAGWQNDLQALRVVAKRHDEMKTAGAAMCCLEALGGRGSRS